MSSMKKYRFFYHYRKSTKGMTVHFRGKCIPCHDIKCQVPCETKWNKEQPQLVMIGWASEVEINNQTVTIK